MDGEHPGGCEKLNPSFWVEWPSSPVKQYPHLSDTVTPLMHYFTRPGDSELSSKGKSQRHSISVPMCVTKNLVTLHFLTDGDNKTQKSCWGRAGTRASPVL